MGMLTAIPMVLVCSPLAGFLLGRWLDLRFSTGQGLTILFVLIGFFAGATESFNIIRKVSSDDEKENHGKK